ncbi:phosphoglucomutase [Paenibacillus montaniterrae]|uniref:Beta-phosphoglucomutase n=1 Tax=Paenibacillus montaniterrae TaxID=429341 RepID=A0A920CW65_9BACL|nr:beta-phosphoglucomutase [Paenibacillus montaniterrae]GIP18952.1 phosphoglucomutase [Paenibacillus montaniterrae]
MTIELQAVIFDLDGVITDTAEHHYLAWKAIGDELKLPFTREFNEKLKGVSRLESLRLLLSLSPTELQYSEQQLHELAERKNELYKQLISQIKPSDVLPGIPELIADLKQRGIKTAIASASKNAFAVIRNLQMEQQFDVIVDAATIKNSKPDPEVFLAAAQQLGVEPKACVGIEDAVAGVEAIIAADMTAIAIGKQEHFPHAHHTYASTAELNAEQLIDIHRKVISL